MIISTPRVGLLINAASGNGVATQAGAKLSSMLAKVGAQVVDCSADSFRASIAKVEKAIQNQQIDMLVAVGGDGTVHCAANAVVGSGIPLGIIPVGTGNDIARDLELPVQNWDAAAKLLIEYLAGDGHLRPIDTVEVRDGSDEILCYYVAILSCGIDAAICDRANHLRFPTGPLRYLRAAFEVIARFKPYGFKVIIDDNEVLEFSGPLASVASTCRFGGGMIIAPQAKFDDGLLDLIVARDAKRAEIAKIMPKLYAGTHLEYKAFSTYTGRKIQILPSDQGRTPPLAMADGEPIANLPLTLEVKPSSVQVVVGKNESPNQ